MRYRGEHRTGLIARLVRAFGPRALLVWALLLVVAFSTASGLAEAVPSLNVGFIFTIGAVGLTTGWLLAQLPMKAWLAAPFTLVLGVEFLLIRVGGLEQEALEAVEAVGRVIWQLVQWYWTEQAPDWVIVPTHFLALWRNMGTLLSRTFTWLYGLVAGRGGWDVIGSALVWGLGVWLYSAWSGWVVRRHHHPLLGVVPGGVLLSFVLSYTGANPYVFLPILGITLVLMALMRQDARESRWSASGVDFSQGLWSDVAMVATGLSIALVLAAAVAPSISAERIADWVREVTDRGDEPRTETVAEGLGLEQRPEPRPVRPLRDVESTALPQEHLIGSGPELSRSVVMIVTTGELPPAMPEDLMHRQSVPRHYWRSITYDRYFGRGWATSGTETIEYEPGEEVTDLDAPHLRTLRQAVRLVGPNRGGRIHVDGTLVSVDQEFSVAWRPPGEIFAATVDSRQYRADSVYPLVTVEDLQSASLDYPDWVMSRYLQLPETVPDRVLALSRDLTATQPTPYDRAKAIEQYLREFPYNLDVPTPGAQADIADYFLFELQEGYCDYYATSMVVLARAAGLPARLVIGYVSGSYDPIDARYVVTEADAHAWPEIYFPEYGWIEFEPTGGRAPIVRSGSSDDEEFAWPEGEAPGPLVSGQQREPSRVLTVGLGFVAVVGAMALAVGLVTGIDSAVLWFSSPEAMTGRLYRRLTKHARRLRIPIRTGDTPHELLDRWVDRLQQIVEERGFGGEEFVEPAIEEIEALTALYIAAWYSRDPEVTPARRRQAVWTWWKLRWRLWLAWLWRRSGSMGRDARGAAGGRVRTGRASSTAERA